MRRLTSLLVILLIFGSALAAQNANVSAEKSRAKDMLRVIAKDIEKNFYDPQLKGMDWKAMVSETNDRIEKAQTVGQVYTAIFVLVDKLDDSHTVFAPPSRAAHPKFGFLAKAYGDEIYIYDVKKGGAADQAGLQKGDRILKVNNFSPSRKSFRKMWLFYNTLQPVSKLDLTILRPGEEPRVVPLQAKVVVEARRTDLTIDENFDYWVFQREVESEEFDTRSSYRLPGEDGIGYLHIMSFSREPETIAGWLSILNKSKGIIIDLRGNPGGRIDSVVNFANQFAAEPDVMAEEITRKKTEPLKLKGKRNAYTGPVAVLVDSDSASASEMFARYMQLKKKATVIGDNTAGAVISSLYYAEQIGTDTVVPFGVQVGVGRIVFPGNEELEKKGVIPDQHCVPTQEQVQKGQDPCYGAAREYLLNASKTTTPEPAK